MSARRVVVIGAGIGGLACALSLAARGADVTLLEKSPYAGGKARQLGIGGHAVDAGPTVFTMRWVFEELLADAGFSLARELRLTGLGLLARHAWDAGGRLDLFTDTERSAEAIAALSGHAEADRFRAFCQRSQRVYDSLERSFMAAPKPSMPGLLRRAGRRGLPGLLATSPFVSLWRALGEHFHDHRLRQLFGRYATYCGSSPWLSPSTLMLVAHAEKLGVWSVEGGMHGLANALAGCAMARGAQLRLGTGAARVEVAGGRAAAVVLEDGERLVADAIVHAGDVQALADGRLGEAVRAAVPSRPRALRSLSALTWCVAARCSGFPLVRHTVFFSSDYAREFREILQEHRLPGAPTVYVCAQSRADEAISATGSEPLLVLVNAPPIGDERRFSPAELADCESACFGLLARCGLELAPEASVLTTPADFEALFPGSGGGLYGSASHGWRSSFTRPGAGSRIPGLYLAGGGVHPGPGVPMVALSGRLAAAAVARELRLPAAAS